MSSTRLPGKTLFKLDNMSILEICVTRLSHPDMDLIVATSTDPSDDAIVIECNRLGIKSFRGSLHSPKKRLLSLLREYNYDIIYRATCDNILPDKKLIDDLRCHLNSKSDYAFVSGGYNGYPFGLCLEAIKTSEIYKYEKQNLLSSEHIIGLLRENKTESLVKLPNLSTSKPLRLTLDTLEDYSFLSRIWKAEYINIRYDALIKIICSEYE